MINIYNIFARMRIFGFTLPMLLFVCSGVFSQPPPVYHSADVYQQISKLGVLGSVLYIAAHPDDENTRLLGWLENEKLLKAGYLSITRGDGGQNLIGDEQGVELGLIRTQELLAARRIDGAEQFFTRAFDFGYSKSTEEALKFWDHKKTLADVVWIIRKFRPDVIVTRFPPDNRAGHGHHSASAVLAQEAFKAAADKNAYPEQFAFGVRPWQAKRLMWNSYRFGSINTTSENHLKIETGGYNPLIGKSYGEIAAASRSQHKSQGFGASPSRGPQLEYFSFVGGTKADSTLLDGIDITWRRLGSVSLDGMIKEVLHNFDVANPSLSVPALLDIYDSIVALPDSYWRSVKMTELQDAVAAASGLWLEAYTSSQYVRQGDSLRISFSYNNRQEFPVTLERIAIAGLDTAINAVLEMNKDFHFSRSIGVNPKHRVTQPYWLREAKNVGSFTVPDQQLIGEADTEPAFIARFTTMFGKHRFVFDRQLVYKNTDPVDGEVYKPFVVLPSVRNHKQTGKLKHIRYDHIPDIHYFDKAQEQIVLQDVKITGGKIGYIEGAGDKLPSALTLMGYDVTLLTEKDITLSFLKQFDAIITGVRAYNVHAFLAEKNDVLNEYVRGGGNVIVQYNTNSNLGPSNSPIGPYPFRISRVRITDEQSPVKLLIPDHPVFHYPNKITLRDFQGWVQERGIYFADQLDPAFSAPLGFNDPGEPVENGGLVIARYGEGYFAYTGIVFFRQMPAGVNGAYRLLANMIALNKPNRKK